MKINGISVIGACEEVVVIPRQTHNFVIRARAIADYEPFEKLCPQPKPPEIMYAGQTVATQNVEDEGYKEQFYAWAEKKAHWMALESLKITEGLVWDTVDMADPSTWSNYQKELSAAGFSSLEQGRILQCVARANGLDQSKIDEATESFLADQAARLRKESSQDSALSVTPSGVPVNV